MKKLMGGLKGFNAKDFFLNHAEKVVFGLVVVAVLAVFGITDWSRIEKTPEQIAAKVQAAEQAIQNSVWPAEKGAAFALRDFAGQAQEVRGPLDVTRYEYSTNQWWPLYRKQELAKEPEYLAVTDLIATPGRFTLGASPKLAEGELMADAGSAAAEMEKDEPDDGFDDQFAPVTKGGAGGASSGMMIPGGPAMAHGGGAMPPAMPGSPEMMMGGAMSSSGAPSGLESRGERFVAVRGVWPIWQQMEKFQRALNLQTTTDARNFLEILDFVLERQTAVGASDPWSGPWEAVDIQRALDVLDEAYDYDIDRLDQQILDPVITMPLPARLVGIWGDLATHPKIEKFTLPPAELEREVKLQEKLIEEFNKFKLQEEKSAPRGFGRQQRNIRGMAETMFSSAYAGEFDATMSSAIKSDPMLRMTLPDLKSRLTAVGRLLLFRYMDFDVRPGFAYRYRVKLALRNPNFERPPEELLDRSAADGAERETPWSNESNVAVVPESVNYFLEDVDRDPVNESKPAPSRPLARFDFYEWDTTVGTMIHDIVEVKAFGQFISEQKKSLRLDVAKPSFKDEEKVAFRSDDLLVDAVADVRLDVTQHPDLQIAPAARGKVGLIPEAVVVNEAGELESLDRLANRSQKASLSNYVRREREPFENIKNKEDKPMSEMSGGEMPGNPFSASAMMMGTDSAGAQPKTKRGRQKSPLKPGMSSAHGGP